MGVINRTVGSTLAIPLTVNPAATVLPVVLLFTDPPRTLAYTGAARVVTGAVPGNSFSYLPTDLPVGTYYARESATTASGPVGPSDLDSIVVAPASIGSTGTDFATADELAARLGVTFNAVQTAQATAAIADVTALYRTHLGRQITLGTYSHDLPSHPSCDLLLPERPVRSVTSVTMDGVAITDFRLVGNVLYRELGWQPVIGQPPFLGRQWQRTEYSTRIPVNINVVYAAGYTVSPPDLKALCLARVAAMVTNPTGVSSEKIDDYAVSYGPVGPLTDADLLGLRRYTRAAFTVPQ